MGQSVSTVTAPGANQAVGGSSLDTQLPAPAFDPQGETLFLFKEESWRALGAGAVALTGEESNLEFSGHVFSAQAHSKDHENPCCEGRWVALREGKDAVCRLFQIKSGGGLTLSATYLPSNDDPFPLAIAKADYQPPAEKELRPCPPIFDGVTPGDFAFYPVAYSSERFNATGPANFVNGNPNTAAPAVPVLPPPVNLGPRLKLPVLHPTDPATFDVDRDDDSLPEVK